MTVNRHLQTYLNGLDASVDGRGFGKEHEQARRFVEGACELAEQLARLTTPTDDIDDGDQKAADEIVDNLDWERLYSDASASYEIIRQARALQPALAQVEGNEA